MALLDNPLPSDVALLLIDIQPHITDNAHTNPAKTIRLAAETAAKAATVLRIPTFVSVVPLGPGEPEPVDELTVYPTLSRKFFGAFNQPEIRDAVAATGRKTLAIGGIVSEVAVLQGARTAMREGYAVYILIDACGGLTVRSEQAAFSELQKAGAILSSVASFFSTIQPTGSTPEGQEVRKLLMALMTKES